MIIKTLGSQLKKVRNKKGYTQQDAADRLGVVRATLANWEVDRGRPDIETLKNISKLYGVSVDYLIGNVGNEIQSSEELEISKRNMEIIITTMQELLDDMKQKVDQLYIKRVEK